MPRGDIRGALLDIQGTLLDAENAAVPGAPEAVAAIKASGVRVRYVTNIDSVGPRTILERLCAAGIPSEEREVFSPVVALRRYLVRQGSPRCMFLLPAELEDLLGDFRVSPGARADIVVVGDMRRDFTYEALNAALRQLLAGAELVALNKGRYYLAPDGPVLDTGAFAAALEHAADRTAYVIGKPSTELLRLALQDISVEGTAAVMVGDDAAADVGGGHAVGARTVLVRTGKFSAEALAHADVRPDIVLDSIAQLPDTMCEWARRAGEQTLSAGRPVRRDACE
jgi:HAD superfamily hydrolase (TIGR01458 family)